MESKNMTKSRVVPSRATREEMAKQLKIERDKDRQMVKGVFKDYEVPGGCLEFCFKKYAEDPLEKYTMHDNQVYTIPLGVAKHLNGNTWYPIHEFTRDENGNPSQKISQKIRRFGFQSLEFMDIDNLEGNINKIITVENMKN